MIINVIFFISHWLLKEWGNFLAKLNLLNDVTIIPLSFFIAYP